MNDTALESGKMVCEDNGRGPAMQTFTGTRFYVMDPRADDVSLIDIAHSLGHICRYGGHCSFYSVAEHSVLVSHMVPPKDALVALFHDATEAYAADLTRPLKRALGTENSYFTYEALIWQAVADKFALPDELPQSVKEADNAICGLERRELHPRADEWDIPYPIPELKISGADPFSAANMFLDRYADITGQDISQVRLNYARLYADSQPGNVYVNA